MKRSKYWREELAEEFRDLSFRREYFFGLVEDEHMEVTEALRRAVKAMGIKEFSKLVKMPASNISRALSAGDYKLSTLEKFLAAFGLSISIEELAG